MAAPTATEVQTRAGVVAFTDVVSFTEFTALQGDEEALSVVEQHEAMLAEALSGEDRIVKNLGDGFLLWYAEPLHAVEALVDFQERLADLDGDDWPLEVRIGAHWGTPLRRGDDVVGHDVNVASRILDVAGPGEVLVSDALVQELSGRTSDLSFAELGPVSMKGIPDPVPLYRVMRAGADPSG